MSVDIPLNIMAQYKQICSKLKGMSEENYKSKIILGSLFKSLEVNKWYLIDISPDWEGKGFTNLDTPEEQGSLDHTELIYVEEVQDRGGKPYTINGYYIPCSYYGVTPQILIFPDPTHTLQYHKGYGIMNCPYIPIDINYQDKFINWIDRNPMELKE